MQFYLIHIAPNHNVDWGNTAKSERLNPATHVFPFQVVNPDTSLNTPVGFSESWDTWELLVWLPKSTAVSRDTCRNHWLGHTAGPVLVHRLENQRFDINFPGSEVQAKTKSWLWESTSSMTSRFSKCLLGTKSHQTSHPLSNLIWPQQRLIEKVQLTLPSSWVGWYSKSRSRHFSHYFLIKHGIFSLELGGVRASQPTN